MKLYVEGGGDSTALKTACREGFTKFITKAGVQKRPRIVACGGRRNAFDSFCTAIAQGEAAMLLVDSEVVVADQHQYGQTDQWLPWGHLRQCEGWDKPEAASDTDCHLMVEVMENWFLADHGALKSCFGQGFSEGALPASEDSVERISKKSVYAALGAATKNSKIKGAYSKGSHSFKLLAETDPSKVMAASPWARRFIEELAKKMSA